MNRFPWPKLQAWHVWRLIVAVLFLMILLPSVSPAYTESDILKAFQEVAEYGSDATGSAKALSFKYSDDLDLLRAQNKITNDVFQANKRISSRIQDSQLTDAARRQGVVYKLSCT